jgi:hypothetical protein
LAPSPCSAGLVTYILKAGRIDLARCFCAKPFNPLTQAAILCF